MNATHINADERNQLIGIIKEFWDFFDGTLVEWDTEPVNLGLKKKSKPFNCKHFPGP